MIWLGWGLAGSLGALEQILSVAHHSRPLPAPERDLLLPIRALSGFESARLLSIFMDSPPGINHRASQEEILLHLHPLSLPKIGQVSFLGCLTVQCRFPNEQFQPLSVGGFRHHHLPLQIEELNSCFLKELKHYLSSCSKIFFVLN